MATRNNLYACLIGEHISDSKKLEVIMLSLADMCSALARKGEDENVESNL
jgi:hypothetical protein